MTERHIPLRARDRLYAVVTLVLAVLLLPAAFARHPGRARELACRWALRMRFPAEDLTGLTDGAMAAFTAARTEALWRHGQLIGLTSGYRNPLAQQRLFDEEVRRAGSPASARTLVLPPAESSHVKGIALDVRPTEGARWLEQHGARYRLYRTYDNEWWHFEYLPEHSHTPPRRLPHPGHHGSDRLYSGGNSAWAEPRGTVGNQPSAYTGRSSAAVARACASPSARTPCFPTAMSPPARPGAGPDRVRQG